jgi:hypothetical protein
VATAEEAVVIADDAVPHRRTNKRS